MNTIEKFLIYSFNKQNRQRTTAHSSETLLSTHSSSNTGRDSPKWSATAEQATRSKYHTTMPDNMEDKMLSHHIIAKHNNHEPPPRRHSTRTCITHKMETKYCTPHWQYKGIKKREPNLETRLTEIAPNYSTVQTTTHNTPHNHTQPTHRETYLNNTTHCYGTIPTRGDNITQSSAPEDGHMVARNMLSNL